MPYAYAHRFVDYSATASPNTARAVLRFVYGIRGHRSNSVYLREIQKYFRATPAKHISETVDKLVERGCLLMLRTSLNRKRTGYVYALTNQGNCLLHQGLGYNSEHGREMYLEPWD